MFYSVGICFNCSFQSAASTLPAVSLHTTHRRSPPLSCPNSLCKKLLASSFLHPSLRSFLKDFVWFYYYFSVFVVYCLLCYNNNKIIKLCYTMKRVVKVTREWAPASLQAPAAQLMIHLWRDIGSEIQALQRLGKSNSKRNSGHQKHLHSKAQINTEKREYHSKRTRVYQVYYSLMRWFCRAENRGSEGGVWGANWSKAFVWSCLTRSAMERKSKASLAARHCADHGDKALWGLRWLSAPYSLLAT